MSLQGLPDSSRIWLFAADRVLSESESEALQQDLMMFVAEWQAHGADLTAGFELRYGACLVIAVDESQAAPTGCSIDKAFRLLQRFGSEHKMDFFNRLQSPQGVGFFRKRLSLRAIKDRAFSHARVSR